ncbi:MAG TPA: hypothetical protein VHE57_13375, partial [Mycobacteriales bacterium]|nr:hypothetical protein [Mycobacteriales bacterium]
MRARVLLPLLGLAAAGLTALPPVMSASASAAATVRVVVKPVTASGHPAPGFTVHRAKHAWERVDCSFKDPSVGAVSPDVEACSPSAAYAIACWKSADPGRVLCTRDPSSHALYELPRDGKFAKTAVAQP